MALRQTLSNKAMLLVGLPFLIQAAVLFGLGAVLDEAERQEEAEYRSKVVIGQTNWLATLCATANLSCLAYVLDGEPFYLNAYHDAKGALKDSLNEWTDTFHSNPDRLIKINEITANTDQLFVTLDRAADAKRDAKSNDSAAPALAIFKKANLKDVWLKLFEERHDLLKSERLQYKIAPLAVPKARKILHHLIAAAGLLDLIVGIALIYIFSNSIARRLKVMIDNTHRFARESVLNPKVGGNDELAELDETFHNMVQHVSEISTKRVEVDRMKHDFLAMVSHDLKTPLTTVQGTLLLLPTGRFGSMNEHGLSMVDSSVRELERLTRMVQDLLDIAKIEAGKFELELKPTWLDNVVNQSVDSVREQAFEKAIEIQYDPNPFVVIGDEDRLIQVIVNILTNAIKFSSQRTSIQIEYEAVDGFVEVRIKDEGRGVPASHLETIFDRFKQVERSDRSEGGGSGLGLAICKSIIEQHGGTIGAVSKLGVGSTFWFRVRLRQALPG
jgi:signal transduction histidine kinase